MIEKQQIVVDLLNERLPQAKVGIIVKGVVLSMRIRSLPLSLKARVSIFTPQR